MMNFSSIQTGEFAIDDDVSDEFVHFGNGSEALNPTNAPDSELPIVKIKRIVTGIAIPILYMFLVVLGILGNFVVIHVSFVSTKKQGARNAVDMYVGNLAIADLFLIATLPFWAAANIYEGQWIFGDAWCKIASFLTHLNMFSSIFIITAMAVDRYIVVVKGAEVRAKSLRTVSKTLCWCALIWLFSAILSLPAAILRQEKIYADNNTYCSWSYPKNSSEVWWALHLVIRNVIGFVIPLSIICRCYCVLLSYVRNRADSCKKSRGSKILNRSDELNEKKKRRVNRLVTAIILAFVICWLPNQLSNFCHSLIHFRALRRPSTKQGAEAVYLVHVFTTVLSFCNSVVNPIIYSTSPSHRKDIKKLFNRVFWCVENKTERKDSEVISEEMRPATRNKRFTNATLLAPTSPTQARTSVTSLTSRTGSLENKHRPAASPRPPTGVEDMTEPARDWETTPRIVVNKHNDYTPSGEDVHCFTFRLDDAEEPSQTKGCCVSKGENIITSETLL